MVRRLHKGQRTSPKAMRWHAYCITYRHARESHRGEQIRRGGRYDKHEGISCGIPDQIDLIRGETDIEAIGTLASGIAHEISTPLQFITTDLTFISPGSCEP